MLCCIYNDPLRLDHLEQAGQIDGEKEAIRTAFVATCKEYALYRRTIIFQLGEREEFIARFRENYARNRVLGK